MARTNEFQRFRFVGVEKRKDAIKLLEELHKGLQSGGLLLKRGKDSIKLTLHEPVEIEVEAESSEEGGKLIVSLRWHNPLPERNRLKLDIKAVEPNPDTTEPTEEE